MQNRHKGYALKTKHVLYMLLIGVIGILSNISIAFSQHITGSIATPEKPAQLSLMHVAGSKEAVRLVLDVAGFDTSAQKRIKSSLLSAPHRLIVDLPDTIVVPQGAKTQGSPGFLKKVQYGTSPEGELRLIIESGVPFLIKNTFVIPGNGTVPTRIVFDLSQTTEIKFRLAITRQAEERRLLQSTAAERKADQIAAVERQRRAEKGDAGTRPRKKRIVIDPGHGGKDGGARTQSGVLEKEIVLSFSKRLAHALSASGAFNVVLTREKDEFISLRQRVAIAREQNADLFISIHADSLPDDRRVRGTAVYTLSERASDAMAASLASQQNKSDAIAGYQLKDAPDDVVEILFDLTRRETSNLSTIFARHFFDDMKPKIRFFKHPLQQGAFRVLRVPDIPSALIELGFLSNQADAKLLSSVEWREKVALEMASTISAYFDKRIASFDR